MDKISDDNKKALRTTILVVGVLAIIIAAAMFYLLSPQLTAAAVNTEEVSNVFLDVNADGKLDLLVEGEVIFNAPLSGSPAP